jgi:hydrogenase expression/formation protein HypC
VSARPIHVTPRGVTPDCHDDVCVTCSDQAVAVTIRRLLGAGMALADVDDGNSVEEISIALVDAQVGDTVLVHAGEAIAVVRRS